MLPCKYLISDGKKQSPEGPTLLRFRRKPVPKPDDLLPVAGVEGVRQKKTGRGDFAILLS
jgi:hypothetical protein